MAQHASFLSSSLSLSLSLSLILASFVTRWLPLTPPLLRRRLEVLVRGVLVAVHLHARHVLLLWTRCLVHLDEALENRQRATNQAKLDTKFSAKAFPESGRFKL